MAAMAVTLIDDPVAADTAAELCEPIAGEWEAAARRGPEDPALRAAVTGCAAQAARRGPAPLRADLEAFVELASRGRSPSSELGNRIRRDGPLRVLEEEARA